MNEVKHLRFCKVVERRMDTLIRDFRLLGRCANKASYDYTDAEVAQILAEIDCQVQKLKDTFAGEKPFSLRTNSDILREKRVQAIALEHPDSVPDRHNEDE